MTDAGTDVAGTGTAAPDDATSSPPAADGLRTQASRSAAWSLAERWLSRGSTTVVVIVLGRLLAPEDFGLVAVAAVVVNVLAVVAEQGFGQAIVRHPDLTDDHLDAAFWGAVGIGGLLTALVLAAAGPLAGLLDEPRAAPMMRVLSVTCVLTSLSSIQRAVLQRAFDFRTIAQRRFVATVTASVLAITAAVLGAGAWALVAQLLAQTALTAALLWQAGSYRPRRSFSRTHFVGLARFGSRVAAMNLLAVANKNADNAVIATTLGSVALGYYVVAYRVVRLITETTLQSLSAVALSGFARLQDDAQAVRRALLDVTRVSSTVAVPVFVGVAAISPTLVPALFGPGWEEAVVPARVLALTGIVTSVAYFDRAVLLAVGRARTAFRLEALQTATNVVAFVVGARWGIVGVSVGLLVAMVGVWPVRVLVLRARLGLRPRDYVANQVAAAASSAVMAAVVVPADALALTDQPAVLRLVLLVLTGALVYVGCMLVVGRPALRQLRDLLGDLRRPGGRRLATT